jgi:hypothetical protein
MPSREIILCFFLATGNEIFASENNVTSNNTMLDEGEVYGRSSVYSNRRLPWYQKTRIFSDFIVGRTQNAVSSANGMKSGFLQSG